MERKEKKADETKTIEELKEEFAEEWNEWNDEAMTEEFYKLPMMNSLYYFPDCVGFNGDEEINGATCLLYDNELEAWAVGMTGGGMDLSPHLLDTFIKLGKGVPMNIAYAIKLDYSAYVDKEKHKNNCKLLAQAFEEKAEQFKNYAKNLKI